MYEWRKSAVAAGVKVEAEEEKETVVIEWRRGEGLAEIFQRRISMVEGLKTVCLRQMPYTFVHYMTVESIFLPTLGGHFEVVLS